MPYVIAKHKDRVGCIALRTNFGQQLVDLKRSIIAEIGYEDVELITISRPSAYGEYAPYHFVKTEEEFRREGNESVSAVSLIGGGAAHIREITHSFL